MVEEAVMALVGRERVEAGIRAVPWEAVAWVVGRAAAVLVVAWGVVVRAVVREALREAVPTEEGSVVAETAVAVREVKRVAVRAAVRRPAALIRPRIRSALQVALSQ